MDGERGSSSGAAVTDAEAADVVLGVGRETLSWGRTLHSRRDDVAAVGVTGCQAPASHRRLDSIWPSKLQVQPPSRASA